MIPPPGRSDSAPWLALLAAGLLTLAGCGSGKNVAPAPAPVPREQAAGEDPSHAADAVIEKAKTSEEKRSLEKARDEVDSEMREKARALDAEIERLRKENEALEKKP